MTRGGRAKDRSVAERQCIATGASQPKAGLIRFVVGPEGQIVPDLAEKLPGRGIWVAADAAALEKAVKKNLFARAARSQVKVDPDLAEQVADLLAERVVSLLSLARKAGQAIAGAEKVKTALMAGEVVCLLQASDGSDREKARLRPPEGEDTHFQVLTAQEMGLAFGRDRVIHAGLIAGGLTAQVRYESARLSKLRCNRQ